LVNALNSDKGLALSFEDVAVAIVRVQKEQLVECGLQPLGGQGAVSRRSLANVVAIIQATVLGITAPDAAIPKTNSRWTAEHSLLPFVSLLGTISTTHLFHTPPSILPGSDYRHIVMTDRARKLKELVSGAPGGLPVSCYHISTEATAAYTFAKVVLCMWKLTKIKDLKGRDLS
jgi:hypothetical protein